MFVYEYMDLIYLVLVVALAGFTLRMYLRLGRAFEHLVESSSRLLGAPRRS